jgi:two-component system alkaline phosphatase synthesis response regulator PhoP
MAYILIVDDDENVLVSLEAILSDEGHDVMMASDGFKGLELITRETFDLVVLDVVMPELDGIEVCRRIRADPFTARLPVLFLTAKGRSGDATRGLDAGGDDYLTKPFEVTELPARVRALLRRAPGGMLDETAEVLTIHNMALDLQRFEAHIGDRVINLTGIEHRLLYCLMTHQGQPVSTSQLLEDVWEYPAGLGNPNLVQVHIGNVRAKLDVDEDSPLYIRNVRGRGYMFTG